MNDREEIIRKVEETWLLASKKLNFDILCPYQFDYNEKVKTAFAFLPDYGFKNGAVIDLIFPPLFKLDQDIIQWAKKNEIHSSFINALRFLDYNEEYFIETLNDFGKDKG
jgi:hypothetical protein